MLDEATKLRDARVTCCEMLEDRGYDVEEIKSKVIGLPMDYFRELYNNNDIDLYVEHKTDKKNKMVVKFFVKGRKKLNESDLKKEADIISQSIGNGNEYTGEPNIIMVSREKPPSNVYNIINTEKYKNVEIFKISELLFNVTHHVLTPKHSRMTNEEQKEVLEFYRAEKKDLPKISVNDPVAKYYGMKIGEICKIERYSETTGFSNFYRHVRP